MVENKKSLDERVATFKPSETSRHLQSARGVSSKEGVATLRNRFDTREELLRAVLARASSAKARQRLRDTQVGSELRSIIAARSELREREKNISQARNRGVSVGQARALSKRPEARERAEKAREERERGRITTRRDDGTFGQLVFVTPEGRNITPQAKARILQVQRQSPGSRIRISNRRLEDARQRSLFLQSQANISTEEGAAIAFPPPIPGQNFTLASPQDFTLQSAFTPSSGSSANRLVVVEPPPSKLVQEFRRVRDAARIPILRSLGEGASAEAENLAFQVGDTRQSISGGIGSVIGGVTVGAAARFAAIPLTFARFTKAGTEFVGEVATGNIIGGGGADALRLPDQGGISSRGLAAERANIPKAEEFFSLENLNRQTQKIFPFFGESKTARTELFTSELERRGFSGEQLTQGVKGLEGQRISSFIGGGLGAFAAIESTSEIIGGRLFIKKGIGQLPTRKERFFETGKITGKLGVGEGAASTIFFGDTRTVTPEQVAIGGALGGATSALLGGFIGSQITKKGLTKGGNLGVFVGRAIDFPGESIGDALGGGVIKTLQRSRRLRVLSPSVSFSGSAPSSGSTVAGVTALKPGLGRLAPVPSFSPTPSAASAAPSQSFAFAPAFSSIATSANVPSSTFVPTSASVPNFSFSPAFASSSFVPSSAPIPTSTPAQFKAPFFFGGGGRSRKGRKGRGRGQSRAFGFAPSLRAIIFDLRGGTGLTPKGGFTGLEPRLLPGKRKKARKKKSSSKRKQTRNKKKRRK